MENDIQYLEKMTHAGRPVAPGEAFRPQFSTMAPPARPPPAQQYPP